MSDTPLISLRNIHVQFGLKVLFHDVTLNVYPKDRIALVGRNGSGKTTLFKTLMNQIELDEGEIFIQPGTRIGYLPQQMNWPSGQSALDLVMSGIDQASTHDKDMTYYAKAMLDKFQANPDWLVDNTSGGERRRVALAYAFASNPDVLLMDEPTNHLDIDMIEFLEKEFQAFPGAIVVISHDRAFLKQVSHKTWWLDRKTIKELNRGYGHFETWSTELLDNEEKALERMDKKLDQELYWLHRGVTARRKRNQGRLARLNQLRAERAAVLTGVKKINVTASQDETSGRLVIEAKQASKTYIDIAGNERQIIKPFSTKILRGDRIGIFGPNGSGKSTLVQLLLKKITPTKGTIRLGTNLSVGYFEQNHHDLKEKETLWSTLCPNGGDHLMVGGRHRHVVAYLKDFLFDIDQIKSPVGSLSGGERNRLALSRILAQNTNILVLDEPTNDLDSDTLDLLVDILSDYEGTLIVVSHDRDFLDRLVTSTISILQGGEFMEFAGGYSDFIWQLENGEKSFLRAPKPVKKLPAKTKIHTNSAPVPRVFGFKQQHQLKELGEVMETLKKQIIRCEDELADPALFQKDAEKFHKLSEKLNHCQTKLLEAEEQWLELELLKEEAEG
ncbi:MAG: ABC-F family ATP-binding cassette domain-containing protein [Candidatus Paracaedibacteraceae bacterium]|nr:ABC-F family ATP-binding cassette domain-containing protein [Candidatus Paracaedibacteraceae bacterium]